MRTRASQSSKGFTLVEIMVVVIILPFVFVIMDGLFRTLLAEIPWSWRIAQENTVVINMLERMHQDLDKAKGLPTSFAGQAANDELLLIELADGLICYQLKDGQVTRRRLTGIRKGDAEETRVWTVPHAKVEWKIWTQNGQGYAVETKTSIEYENRGQWNRKMANSHLYFVGAL
jgi:prepilin-type N-terminal cleavage/methylation domain-containing protein